MSPNRMIALLTPLVFAPLAGTVMAWAAGNLPGIEIPSSGLTSVFIAGALIAFGLAGQWVHGFQKWEARADEATMLAARAFTEDIAPVPVAMTAPADDLFDDDLSDEDDLTEFDDLEVEPGIGPPHGGVNVGDRAPH